MKLAPIALAAALTLSSTLALAYTHHHRSGVRTHHTVGMNPATYRGSMNNYGWSNNVWNRGGPNNRGGLVGGDDAGTYKP
jgi:hypothetical protein